MEFARTRGWSWAMLGLFCLSSKVAAKTPKIFIHDVLEGIFMGHFLDLMTLNKWTLRWMLKAVGIFKPWHKYGRKSLTGFT